MFAQLLPALHLHHALISDKPLGHAEQFGQLVVQIRAVRYQYDCRTGELPAPHQHPRQKQHRDTLSAPRRAEIGATFAIPVRAEFGVQTDILEQLVRGKELRITTNNLPFILRRIREKDKVFQHAQQPLPPEQPLHHRLQRVDAVKSPFFGVNLAPCIEKVVGSEQRAVFIVHTVTDNDKRIVFEQLGNIPPIPHRQLPIGIHDGCLLLDGTFELQHHHRQTVHIDNPVGDAGLRPLDFQLIDYSENIVRQTPLAKVNRLDIQIGQRAVVALQRKPLHHQPIGVQIVFIQRESHVGGEFGHGTLDFERCDSGLAVATAEIGPQIVAQQDIAHLLVNLFTVCIDITLLPEKLHNGHFEGIFVEVGHD